METAITIKETLPPSNLARLECQVAPTTALPFRMGTWSLSLEAIMEIAEIRCFNVFILT